MITILTGHRKSGTTLLLSLLDSHKDLSIISRELEYPYSYFGFYTEKYKKNKKELIKRLLKINLKLGKLSKYSHRFKLSKIKKKQKNFLKNIKKINLLSKREVLNAAIKNYFEILGEERKNILVFKTTSQVIFFEEYKKIYKNFKMVNIVRDPRDNYASIFSGQKKYYDKIGLNVEDNLFNSLFSIYTNFLFSKIYEKEKNLLNIKYENLVRNPKKTLKKICKFIGIKFHNSLLVPTILGKKYSGNNFGTNIERVSPINVNRWKQRIKIDKQIILNFYLKGVMNIYNYKNDKIKSKKSLKSVYKFYEKVNAAHFFRDALPYSKLRK